MTTTRSRLIATVLGLVALTLGLVSPTAMVTRAATPDRILVYVGNSGISEGYTRFGTAAGRRVDTSYVLPADLSPYACIVLPLNHDVFWATQKTAFAQYLAGGGRILALGGSTTSARANATMTDLATTLGTGLSIIPTPLYDYSGSTSNIAASPLTTGVVRIGFGGASALAVTPEANPTAAALVRNSGGTPIVAAARVGNGVFVLSGDSHVFSDALDHAYTVHDNGIFVAAL